VMGGFWFLTSTLINSLALMPLNYSSSPSDLAQ